MIFANDLPRMTAFYAGTLGLKPIEATRMDNYVEFETGGAIFALHAIPAEMRCEPVPAAPRENFPVKLTFDVADPEAEHRRLEALEVPSIQRPWGACDYVDPEGNIFGILASKNS